MIPVLYDERAWASQEASTLRFEIPRSRPLRALIIDTDLDYLGGADNQAMTKAETAPESLYSRIQLLAGKDVIVNLTGPEAWLVSCYKAYTMSFKDLSTFTLHGVSNMARWYPKSMIVLPFGEDSPLQTAKYTQVTLDLTIGPTVNVASTSPAGDIVDATSKIRIGGIEQDYVPEGAPVRRFLRQEKTPSATGDFEIELPVTEMINALMLVNWETNEGSVSAAKDPNNDNITDVQLHIDLEGQRPIVVDTNWLMLHRAGLVQGSCMQLDDWQGASTPYDSDTFKKLFTGTVWMEFAGKGSPLDLRGATRAYLRMTAAAAKRTCVIRDVFV